MSLDSGRIDHTDLSPNAGILGTQIADKTLSLRNLSDDTFGIVSTGVFTFTGSTISTPTGGSVTQSFAHGLGYVPMILAAAFYGGSYSPLPYIGFTPGTVYQGFMITVVVDATNVYFSASTFNEGVNFNPTPIKYWLLQETAAPS